jgi:hypothetical protein
MTDHHISSRPDRGPRPVVRDLRFAGTVAAGLCVGVLGVGAIAAPLVGWNSWPDALTTAKNGPSLTVTSPAPTSGSHAPRQRTSTPARIGVVGPVAVSGTVLVTTPGGALGGSAIVPASAGSGAKPAPAGSGTSSHRTVGSESTSSSPQGNFGGSTGFVKPVDTDGDKVPDAYENANGMNPTVNDANADDDGDGIPNIVEYHLRSAANNADSNSDGVADGSDDFDGDGVRNSVEVQLGTSPVDRADGNDDSDGDGIPNAVEQEDGTDPSVSDTTPAPETPPASETDTPSAPVDSNQPAPVETPAPTDNGTPAGPDTPVVAAPPADSAPAPAEPSTPVQPADQTPSDNSGQGDKNDDKNDDKNPDQHAPVADPSDHHATKPDPVALDDHHDNPVPTDPPDTGGDHPAATAAPAVTPPPLPADPPVQATPPAPAPAPVTPAPAAQTAPPAVQTAPPAAATAPVAPPTPAPAQDQQ